MAYAVILDGGRGERFWPLSREAKPKQSHYLVKGKSFLRHTFERLRPGFRNKEIYVVAHSSHIRRVSKELPELNNKNIIAEPLIRNTATSVTLIARLLQAKNPQAVMVTLPSDHVVKKGKKLLAVISAAVRLAQKSNCLVAIGIKPRYAATGYGYLKIKSKRPPTLRRDTPNQKSKCKIYKVEKFTEKPNKATASRFLNSKNYLWNSGIFVFKASAILEAVEKYLPHLHSQLARVNINEIVYNRQALGKIYSRLKTVSLDYGIMEKAKNIYVLEGDFFWDDLGSWATIERIRSKDKAGNVVIGRHENLQTKNTTIISEGKHTIATVGISDTIIVHTRDATLVCSKDKAEEVKKLVKKLDQRLR